MTENNSSNLVFTNEILVVDDTSANLKLLVDILKGAGYAVRPANGGSLALRTALLKPPSLILLDINMPEMDGFEVCKKLKDNSSTASIPIIFISALNDESAIVNGFKSGGVDYITKPFHEEEVLARVKTHLNLINTYTELEWRNKEVITARDNLEEEVKKRTSELVATNIALNQEIVERKNAQKMIQHQMDHLSALSEIDRAINASLDLNLTLDMLLRHVVDELEVDAVGILLFNPDTQLLQSGAARGFRTDLFKHVKIRLGDQIAGQVATNRRLVQINDLRIFESQNASTFFEGEDFISYYGMPLISKGNVKGVLEVFQRTRQDPSKEWFEFLAALAGQASIAIDNALLYTGLQLSNSELTIAYDATIEGWSRALDLRDNETEGHTQRVTSLTAKLALEYGLKGNDITNIRRGAILHDIGKMGIPDNVLLKPGPLTDDEWLVMKKHPVYANELLLPIKYLHSALDIPFCHHEKWDGSGYPQGLKAEQIPIPARLFMVVDVYDALTSDRPYRSAWSKEKTLNYIKENSGSHFDPKVVDFFFTSRVYEN